MYKFAYTAKGRKNQEILFHVFYYRVQHRISIQNHSIFQLQIYPKKL